MRRLTKFFMSIALVSMMFLAVVGAATAENNISKHRKDPIAVIEQYFNALIAGNIDEAVDISIDKKFNSKEIQREQYADSNKHHPLLSYEITDIDKTNPDDIKLQVSLTYPEFGKLPAQPFSVIKENDDFIVVVESVVMDFSSTNSNGFNSTEPTIEHYRNATIYQ